MSCDSVPAPRSFRRSPLLRAAALLVPAFLALPAAANRLAAQGDSGAQPRAEAPRADGSRADPLPRDPEDARVREALDRGIRFLIGEQGPSGAIGTRFPVAVTALSGLAILGAGYGYQSDSSTSRALQSAVGFLLQCSADGRGYISDRESKMHGHSYAILFLTQIHGQLGPSPRQSERVQEAIAQGLKQILKSQSKQGGFYYTPENREGADEGSLTVCALQALRAANSIGFVVPKSRIDQAKVYLRNSKTSDGSFQYSLTQGLMDNHTSYALTVAAVASLQAAGEYDAPEVKAGMDFARRMLARHPGEPLKAAEKEWFYYANLYAAQACYQAGGELGANFQTGARRYLLERQSPSDGRFTDETYGDAFATAMALLILEVPLNYLPIFER